MDTEATSRAARVAARKASQDKNLFGRLQAAATASRGQAQRLLQSAGGLSITQWRILWDLNEAGPLSVQDLASIQRTDHSLISRALPALRENGHVTMAPNTGDKRQSLVALTPCGIDAYKIAAPIMQRRRTGLAKTFTPEELAMFLHLLSRFEASLGQTTEDFSAVEETS